MNLQLSKQYNLYFNEIVVYCFMLVFISSVNAFVKCATIVTINVQLNVVIIYVHTVPS